MIIVVTFIFKLSQLYFLYIILIFYFWQSYFYQTNKLPTCTVIKVLLLTIVINKPNYINDVICWKIQLNSKFYRLRNFLDSWFCSALLPSIESTWTISWDVDIIIYGWIYEATYTLNTISKCLLVQFEYLHVSLWWSCLPPPASLTLPFSVANLVTRQLWSSSSYLPHSLLLFNVRKGCWKIGGTGLTFSAILLLVYVQVCYINVRWLYCGHMWICFSPIDVSRSCSVRSWMLLSMKRPSLLKMPRLLLSAART